MNQKGISSIVIILIIVGVLALGTGVWYYFNFCVYNPMVWEPTIWCDIDSDKDCDTDDAQLITNNLGKCAGSPNFNELADVDHNGCVTLDDRDRLFSEINKIENWQTYRNEKYGFEIKYPSTWKQCALGGITTEEFILTGTEQKCLPGPHDKPTDIIVISTESAIFKQYPTITSLKRALEETKSSVNKIFKVSGIDLFEIGEVKEITFNGMPALWVEQVSLAGLDESIGIYIFHNQIFIRVAFVFRSVDTEKEGNQILSTFKFIK